MQIIKGNEPHNPIAAIVQRFSIITFLLLAFNFSVAIADEAPAATAPEPNQLALPSTDINAPTVKHSPPITRDSEGGLPFSAIVRDDVAVRSVTLFYRAPNTQEFKSLSMQRQLSNSDTYAARLDKSLLPEKGVEYYIKAEDTSGNTLLHGYSFSPIILSFDGGTNTVAADPESIAAFDKNAMPGASTPLWKNKWLWIGIGAVAVAAAASSGSSDSGGGGGGAKPGPAVPVTVTTPALQ